jgi:hypothetical protein
MAFTVEPGSTTAIGSLPHATAEEAVAFVLDSGVDVPSWPQLPRRDFREFMVPQYAEQLPGFRVDEERKRFRVERDEGHVERLTAFYEKALDPASEFPLSPSHAAGFFEFEQRLAGRSERVAFVKGQVTGPMTFLLGLNLEDGRPIHADEELRQAAVMLLSKNAAWQARRLRPLARDGVLVFVDEPIYSALGTAAYLSVRPEDVRSAVNEVARAARAEGAVVGLHCCAGADWETVLSTEIDVLSFDAWGYMDTLAVYARAVGEFIERGGVLAWGGVPTSDEIASADEARVAERLERGIEALAAKGVPRERLLRQAVITPSCGCGSRTVEETERVFRLLRSTREHWQSRL